MTSMAALTLAILGTLAVPFCLIAGAVISLIRHTEDDELIDRLGRGELPDGEDELEQLLDAWRGECDAPTEPALEAPA